MVKSVLIVDRSTRGAPLTSAFGVDERHKDAGTSGFVRDECLQRTERRVTKPRALGTAGLDPFANALEAFKADAATGALRLQRDRPRDAVVFVPLEPPLFSRELAKLAFGDLGAATLQSGAAPRHALADLLALAVAGQIALALAHHGLDPEASFEGPDRHDVVGLEADNSVVARSGRVLIEPARRVLGIGFVGVGNLSDAPNCDLGCELEGLLQIPIAQRVRVELPHGPALDGSRSQPIISFIHPPEGVAQDVSVLRERGELELGDPIHSSGDFL